MFNLTRPTVLLTLVALAVVCAGHGYAQSRNAAYAWPRTFSGQPDFEFSKKDILDERAKQAETQGLPTPIAPTLADLISDESINLATETPSADPDDVDTHMPLDATSATTLDITNLPSLTTVGNLDLTEFRASLRHAVRRAVKAYQFQPGRMSLGHTLRGLTVQAVVTSPERYAVLNGKRYKEGESLPVSIWAGPSDAVLLDAMAAQLPAEGSMTEAQASLYQDAYEEAVRELASARITNPHVLQKQVMVPATVLAIQHRKVVLEFNGQRHDLEIRFAY